MKVIATDLDRTLIPNGHHRLSKSAMDFFKKSLKKNNVKLIFVTGRYKRLIEDGIVRYNLPNAKYCVALVGVIVYEFINGKLIEHKEWQNHLERNSFNCTRENVHTILNDFPGIWSQHSNLLHRFKQSYYVSIDVNKDKLLKKIDKKLKKGGIDATLIYSIDTNRNLAMVDIMPQIATKLNALKFVLKLMKIKTKDIMFAGDSGNDLSILTSGFKSVLVKNALGSVKDELMQQAKKLGNSSRAYIAKGNFTPPNSKLKLNGNYVSGIIEGAYHFGIFK